ncbi:MAG: hypothetical protein WEG36_06030 [Gemmatimonadota bacterium]
MTHLTTETLARLVDEAPSFEEAGHLESCATCTAELEALRAQTEALLGLPSLSPPGGSWSALEEKLCEEGLMRRDARYAPRPALPWMRMAAALVLFLGGAGLGAAAASWRGGTGNAETAVPTAVSLDQLTLEELDQLTLEEAEAFVSRAQARQVAALLVYADVLGRTGGTEAYVDPFTRLVLLDIIAAAAEAAIHEAPADPFLNGVFVNTVAERQLALDGLSLAAADLR